MKCQIAKQSTALMNTAIRHYLSPKARAETPLFTFESLYSKCEPYPLAEVLLLLNERIAQLKQEREESPNITNDLITIHTLETQQARLTKIYRRQKAE